MTISWVTIYKKDISLPRTFVTINIFTGDLGKQVTMENDMSNRYKIDMIHAAWATHSHKGSSPLPRYLQYFQIGGE